MAKILFMGTPDFATPALEALIDTHQVVGVVTQPDRPAGRGQRPTSPPVKRVALEYSRPLSQPQSLRSPAVIAQLAEWGPEVIVVAAFGQILSQDMLDLPPHGCLNLHASLLPRWRGAAPVAAAILAGDKVTGVTIMQMDKGLDTGPLLSQREVPIRPGDTQITLEERLAQQGAELLIETLPPYLSGELLPRPQLEEAATYAKQLRKEDGRLDWSRPAVELDWQIRAFTPWPGTFTMWHGRRLKVLQAAPLPGWRGDAPLGTIVDLADGAAVATSEGALCLKEVQLAGKRAMDISAFLCGQRDFVGGRLGTGEE